MSKLGLVVGLLNIVLPPPQYDRPPTVPVNEYVLKAADVQYVCGAHVVACSLPMPDKCIIIIPAVESGIVSAPQQERIRRHEIGHCNGWSKDHEDSRQ